MQHVKKPALEMISPEFGSSFTITQFSESCLNLKSPFWHFHPEIEIVYVKNGTGKRHIGNHLSCYNSGDLVLIGSMLPHKGFTDRLSGNQSETVIQFDRACFGPHFFDISEMQEIQQLLIRAQSGIAFTGESKHYIGSRMEKLASLDKFSKMVEFICILQDMAWSKEYQILNADGYALEVEHSDNDRITLVYDYVQANFKQPISLKEISDLVNMAIPSFCRYFKKLTGKTFTRFVNEIRIVHACKLLNEDHLSISDISFESGFNNFSHFNRLFKDITGQNPSVYRRKLNRVLIEESDSK